MNILCYYYYYIWINNNNNNNNNNKVEHEENFASRPFNFCQYKWSYETFNWIPIRLVAQLFMELPDAAYEFQGMQSVRWTRYLKQSR